MLRCAALQAGHAERLPADGTVAKNQSAVAQARLLRALGLPYGPSNTSVSAPWWHCFNRTCQALLK